MCDILCFSTPQLRSIPSLHHRDSVANYQRSARPKDRESGRLTRFEVIWYMQELRGYRVWRYD